MTLHFSVLGKRKPPATLSKPDRPENIVLLHLHGQVGIWTLYTCRLYYKDMPVPDQCYCFSPNSFTPVRVPLQVPPELLELSTSKTTSPLRPVQETCSVSVRT